MLLRRRAGRRRRRGPGDRWRASRAARLPMVDRVEVSIIDEAQPRWLSFLNGQARLHRSGVPARVHRPSRCPAASSRRTWPGAASSGKRTLNADIDADLLQHGGPGGRRLRRRTRWRCAARSAWRCDIAARDPPRAPRPGDPGAVARSLPHTSGYDPAFKSEMSDYDPARAKALLDLYGYVDRDGDGWREQPDGTPLVLEYATQPDQLSRAVRRAVEEEHGRDRRARSSSRPRSGPRT